MSIMFFSDRVATQILFTPVNAYGVLKLIGVPVHYFRAGQWDNDELPKVCQVLRSLIRSTERAKSNWQDFVSVGETSRTIIDMEPDINAIQRRLVNILDLCCAAQQVGAKVFWS